MTMTSKIVGPGLASDTPMGVDKTHGAARFSLRPPETGIYGSYRMSLLSGVIAAGIAANSPVWEMRWGGASVIAIVRKLRIQAVVSTTPFAAGAADSSFSLFKAQGFSALDTTGASVAAFTVGKTGVNAGSRMAASQLSGDSTALRTAQGGIAISNTAAMSGGTKTLDTQAIATVINRIIGAAAAETIITPEPAPYLIDPAECPVIQPIELSQNEGLVLRADAITATGTWRLAVDVAWDEIDPARYFSIFA